MPTRREAERTGLMAVEARTLLHGCVAVTTEQGGWTRPHRLTIEQVRTVGSCLAWHPGLMRQMARTTAGITLEFVTDASEVSLEVVVDAEPNGTASVLERIDGEERAPHDGISADVDGRHIAPRLPKGDAEGLDFTLDDVEEPDAHGMLRLPGFGVEHRVRIWLPALRGCMVRTLVANGTYVKPVPERPQLLVFGDSIAQGFVTDDPATSWPALLADRLGLDLVNQALGGQVFQTGTYFGLAHLVNPALVVVAFGENYRFEPCAPRPVARDIRSYLADIARIWPEVPTYVLTPLFHDEALSPSHPMSCWRRVPSMIAANAAVHDEMTLVEGSRLLDERVALLADVDGHPSAEGARQIAGRLYACMLAERGDAQARRERALDILGKAPERAFPLLEGARRGIGSFVVAEEGCVLWDVGEGRLMLYAPDHELGRAVVGAFGHGPAMGIFEEDTDFVRSVQLACGLPVRAPFYLALYEDEGPLEGGGRDVRQLDETYLDAIDARLRESGLAAREGVSALLREGRMLGAFEEGELAGFVGEHADGSIGLIEVLEGHERQATERALVVAKANQALARGEVPWCEVFPQDRALLGLVRSLGFRMVPASGQCFLSVS